MLLVMKLGILFSMPFSAEGGGGVGAKGEKMEIFPKSKTSLWFPLQAKLLYRKEEEVYYFVSMAKEPLLITHLLRRQRETYLPSLQVVECASRAEEKEEEEGDDLRFDKLESK